MELKFERRHICHVFFPQWLSACTISNIQTIMSYFLDKFLDLAMVSSILNDIARFNSVLTSLLVSLVLPYLLYFKIVDHMRTN